MNRFLADVLWDSEKAKHSWVNNQMQYSWKFVPSWVLFISAEWFIHLSIFQTTYSTQGHRNPNGTVRRQKSINLVTKSLCQGFNTPLNIWIRVPLWPSHEQHCMHTHGQCWGNSGPDWLIGSTRRIFWPRAGLVLTVIPFIIRFLILIFDQFRRMQTTYWSWAQHPARQENIQSTWEKTSFIVSSCC